MTGIMASDRAFCRSTRYNFLWKTALFGLTLATLPGSAQNSGPDFVAARTQQFTPRLVAYGQVEPVAVATVAAAESGVITGLRVKPGMHVRSGQELARLTGPVIASLLLQNQADIRSAKAQLDAAGKSLAIQREQLPSHLTTRQAVHQAESSEAQARTGLDNAQARLTAIHQMVILTAPADGIVLSLAAANGSLVSPGQAVLTMQSSGSLWLRATYYGSDVAGMRVGLSGTFNPSDGSPPIPVRVASIPGAVTPGGGESIALEPTKRHATWLNGEAGTVTLNSSPRNLVEVPTRALIMNDGKWWVLVHTAKGNHPQQVVPGPAQGWNTFLEGGLAPGTEVVVNNAYLLFHSGIAEQFQIPD